MTTTTRRANLQVVEVADEAPPGDRPAAREPELIYVDPRVLHEHPKNPRRRQEGMEELIQSVRSQGVLEPLLAVPDEIPDGLLLVAGHRRRMAAIQAGLASVPVVVRWDLTDEARQIETMLVENGRRSDLTPLEEARGYQLLLDLELPAKQIARDLGLSERLIRARTKLLTLPDKLQEQIQSGQLTLADAEALSEFAGDAKAIAKLSKQLGSENLRYTLAALRNERKQRAEIERTARELKKQGRRVIPRPQGIYDDDSPVQRLEDLVDAEGQPLDPVRHLDCPGHVFLRPGGDGYGSKFDQACDRWQEQGHHNQWAWRRGQYNKQQAGAVGSAAQVREQEAQLAAAVAARTAHIFTAAALLSAQEAHGILATSNQRNLRGLMEREWDPVLIHGLAGFLGGGNGVQLPEGWDGEPADDAQWSEEIYDALAAGVQAEPNLQRQVALLWAFSHVQLTRSGSTAWAWNRQDFRNQLAQLQEKGYELSPLERRLLEEQEGQRAREAAGEGDEEDDAGEIPEMHPGGDDDDDEEAAGA